MKKITTALLTLSILSTLVFLKKDALVTWAQDYATTSIQEAYGSQLLAPEWQERVRSIAERMKISEPFQIRKMNTFSLQRYGYHNAIAVQSLLFNFIPTSAAPFLFISEGFFQDLSSEEQIFLIGHELVHIEKAHLRYYTLIFYVVLVLGVLLWWLLLNSIRFVCGKRVWLYPIVSIIMISCFSNAITIISFAYKRSIEQEADLRSLSLLHSHDGGLALIKRWQKEFRMPLHNDWWGLFSDHPSCHERITYVTNDKQHQKGISYELC